MVKFHRWIKISVWCGDDNNNNKNNELQEKLIIAPIDTT